MLSTEKRARRSSLASLSIVAFRTLATTCAHAPRFDSSPGSLYGTFLLRSSLSAPQAGQAKYCSLSPLRPWCSDTANRCSVQLQTLETLELEPFLEHPTIRKTTPCHTPTPRLQTPSTLVRRSSSASACDLLGSDGHPLNYGSYAASEWRGSQSFRCPLSYQMEEKGFRHFG